MPKDTKKAKAAKAADAPEVAAEEKAEETSPVIRFHFSDVEEVFELNPFGDLTQEEKVIVEETFDAPWNILLAEGWITGSQKALVLFSYLARRRKQPDFTYDQALQYMAKEEHSERPTGGSSTTGSPT